MGLIMLVALCGCQLADYVIDGAMLQRTEIMFLSTNRRARLDHYLHPPTDEIIAASYLPNRLFRVNPHAANEPLLAGVSETLGSATVMINDLAWILEGTHRQTMWGIAQMVMLGSWR